MKTCKDLINEQDGLDFLKSIGYDNNSITVTELMIAKEAAKEIKVRDSALSIGRGVLEKILEENKRLRELLHNRS